MSRSNASYVASAVRVVDHPINVPTQDKTGRTFHSIRACARAHKVNRATVTYHLDTHGNLDLLGTGNRRATMPSQSRPVTIGKRTWPSRVAAAADLGISVHQLRRWISPKATPLMRDMLYATVMAVDAGRRAAA